MSRRVLVADDDADNRTILRDALSAAGHTIFEATDGEAALRAAARETPEVMILDMSMPVMDGWEVARRLSALPRRKEMKVIAFTAHALAGDEERALRAGCDAYLAKPCAPSLILRTIDAVLRPPAGGASSHGGNT